MKTALRLADAWGDLPAEAVAEPLAMLWKQTHCSGEIKVAETSSASGFDGGCKRRGRQTGLDELLRM